MQAEQEAKLLELLYDRLYDAVTYAPAGKGSAFPKNSYFQMGKNLVLNPEDFEDMMSPANPNGDQNTAEFFSAMVDQIPVPGALWQPSGQRVSDVAKGLLAQANTTHVADPEQKQAYETALDYLQTTTEVKDARGNKKLKTEPSDVALAYDDAQAAYIAAISGYRTAFNAYDLTDRKAQRDWNAVAPMLQNLVDRTWNGWNRASKAEVEEAQQIMASSINDAVSYAISQAQEAVSASHQLPSSAGGTATWLPSYANPTNWADPAGITGAKLTLKSADVHQETSSSAHSYGLEAKGQWGLFHASGGVNGEIKKERSHLDAQNLTVSAELLAVQIMRPWFNPLLLDMKGWSTGQPAGSISNGDRKDPKGTLGLLPTGFVVARNVQISGDFSNEDKEFMSSVLESSVEAGWGPFALKAKYGHSISNGSMTSNLTGGTLTVPGMQIIAWISTVPSFSPPE